MSRIQGDVTETSIGGLSHQAVLRRDDAPAIERLSACAAYPGHRPAIGVPVRSFDQVVAVAQGGEAPEAILKDEVDEAYLIPRVAADEAVGVGDGAARPRAAVAPGRRPAIAVPIRTSDHVV